MLTEGSTACRVYLLLYMEAMSVGGGRQIAMPGRDLPEGVLTVLAGTLIGVFTGLALARTGDLPSVLLVGAVAIVGLTPLAVALGRLALPTWVALFGLLYPFVRLPAEGPIVTFDRLFLGALLLGFALEHRRRPLAPETVWLQRSFLVLAAVFLLSALTTAADAISNLAIWTDAFLLPLIVFACARVAARERRQLAALAGAIAFAGAAIAALGLAQRFAGLDLAPLLGSVGRFDTAIGEVRISGPFPAPEPFALVLLGCLAGTLLWMRAGGSDALLPGAAALGLELTAIFFTYFRAAWLGAILILLIAFVASQHDWWKRIAAIAAAAASLTLAVAVGDEDVRTRLQDRQNVSGRLATYERGVELFSRHPVSGVGFQKFEAAVREVPQERVEGVRAIPQAHSSIVSTLAELGLIGFLPLLACAATAALALRALWRRAADPVDRAVAICVSGAALAFLSMSATLTMIYYGPPNAVMALLLGLACGRLDALPTPRR